MGTTNMTTQVNAVDEMFDRYFKVRYKTISAMRPEEIERNGIRMSGFPELDNQLQHQMTNSQMTVDMMFEHWRRGVTIRVVNYADTAEIYRIIQVHLDTWMTSIRESVNGCDEKFLIELIELDQFAGVVYGKARSVFSDMDRKKLMNPNTPFMDRFLAFSQMALKPSRIESVHIGNDGKETKTFAKILPGSQPDDIKDRRSYQDSFADQLNRVQGWRKPK